MGKRITIIIFTTKQPNKSEPKDYKHFLGREEEREKT